MNGNRLVSQPDAKLESIIEKTVAVGDQAASQAAKKPEGEDATVLSSTEAGLGPAADFAKFLPHRVSPPLEQRGWQAIIAPTN